MTSRAFHPIARRIAAGAVLCIACALAGAAGAAEPRPWLCRNKPVFSADKPMRFSVSSRGRRHWRIFFMQFEPGAAHDGFEIVSTADIPIASSSTSGQLNSGRYFAVALYLGSGGHWVCPESAEEGERRREPGVISNLCYSEEEDGDCRVSLVVRRAGDAGVAPQ